MNTWLPWVWTTPLGGPVVPEVYTIVAMSSGCPVGDPAGQLALERVGAVAAELAQRLPGEHPGLLALIALHHHDLLEAVHLVLHLGHLRELGRRPRR